MAELSQDQFNKELNNLLRENQDTVRAIGRVVLYGVIDTYLQSDTTVSNEDQKSEVAQEKAVAAATV